MKHDITLLAARIVGPMLIALGVAFITQPARVMGAIGGFFEDQALTVFAAAATLAAGLTLVTLHRSWNSISAILISLIGVLLAARGALLLLAPVVAREIYFFVFANATLVPIAGCVMALAGVWLAYTGYIAGTLRVDSDR